MELIFLWRNDPWIVSLSNSKKTVGLDEHKKWFREQLDNHNTIMFIIENNGLPIGQIRLEKGRFYRAEVEISIYIMKEHIGKGIGVQAIKVATDKACKLWPGINKLVATILHENHQSISAFNKAGFYCTAKKENVVVMCKDIGREDDDNIDFYERRIREYKEDYKSLDWGSQKTQYLRFQVLSDIGIKENDSVLDVGCGLGNYLDWRSIRNLRGLYKGIDITPTMIEIAKKREDEKTSFEHTNIDTLCGRLECYDYVIASGIFAKRKQGGIGYLSDTVERMFSLCKKGVAFNSLCSFAEEQCSGEFYADPYDVMKFCQTLTPWVSLRMDYHDRDFTVYLYRERQK